MKVLVTGGAGFIGGHVARRLLERGDEARVLDNLHPMAHGTAPAAPSSEVEFVEADLRDARAVAKALRGVDAVIHQGALVGMGVDMSDAPEYVGCNDLGTAVLLSEMAHTGIGRLVLASSMVVYGEGAYECAEHGGVRPPRRDVSDLQASRFDPQCPHCGHDLTPGRVNEDARLDPRSVYAATKLAQEHLSAAWASMTGAAAVALRYHNVYGPGMPRDTPYAGVASIFRSALERNEAPRVFEDGRQRRDFIHVADVARANLAALAGLDAFEGTASSQLQPGLSRIQRRHRHATHRRRDGIRTCRSRGRPRPGDNRGVSRWRRPAHPGLTAGGGSRPRLRRLGQFRRRHARAGNRILASARRVTICPLVDLSAPGVLLDILMERPGVLRDRRSGSVRLARHLMLRDHLSRKPKTSQRRAGNWRRTPASRELTDPSCPIHNRPTQQRRSAKTIGPRELERRALRVGDLYTFQGDERTSS